MADQHQSVEQFSSSITSPGEARRWVAAVLDSWEVYDRREDLQLLVSELVNNAILHCRSGVEVAITQPDGAIHVEVFDDGAGQLPVLNESSVSAEHGRGLRLVDAVADRWGHREVPPRKVVWFDVSI